MSLDPISFQDFNGTTGVPSPSSDIKLLDDDVRTGHLDDEALDHFAGLRVWYAGAGALGDAGDLAGDRCDFGLVAQLSVADVTVHCRKEMTTYKVPKVVRVVDVLPKSTVGNILRRELREIA